MYKISPLGIKGSGDPPIPKGTMPRPLTENVSIATFPLLENNNCSSPFFKNNLMKSMDFDNFYLKGRGIVDVWIGGPRDLSILMRFLSLKSSTFHKILYFCVPKDGVNASAFSCMSSSGDRTFSFARQISQSPFLHQRNDQWRSILLSNFSFYRLVSAFRRRTRTTEGMKFFIIISIDPIIYSKKIGLHYKFKKQL